MPRQLYLGRNSAKINGGIRTFKKVMSVFPHLPSEAFLGILPLVYMETCQSGWNEVNYIKTHDREFFYFEICRRRIIIDQNYA